MPAGFKTKVVAPRNPKLVKRETVKTVKVSTLIYLNTFLFFTLFVKQLNLCLQTSTNLLSVTKLLLLLLN